MRGISKQKKPIELLVKKIGIRKLYEALEVTNEVLAWGESKHSIWDHHTKIPYSTTPRGFLEP